MIEKIAVSNFKSLANFSLPLAKFSCLIGMNGVGKSTILQAMDFVAHLMLGNVQGWLDSRGWRVQDLNCKLRKESNIMIRVMFRTNDGKSVHWAGTFNRATLRCTTELAWVNGRGVMSVREQHYRMEGRVRMPIPFVYQGSILSALKDSELSPEVLEFRDSLRSARSLELLSPQLMRKSARNSDVDIGAGGERLAGYLAAIQKTQGGRLVNLLQEFYPQLSGFSITHQKAGWKKLSITEGFKGQELRTDALHMSDGVLRVLAILAQAGSDRSLILLDEVENGINPEIIEKLVDALRDVPQQIIVTTHSPMVLNYLPDDVAHDAVQFIYRNPDGETRSRPFFSIPRLREKLEVMGPGEAFVDTDLRELTKECVALDQLEDAARLADEEDAG